MEYIKFNSSTVFLTSALEGAEGSASRPGRTLPPGKTRYPLYRRLGGPHGWSGHVQKISPPSGFDRRTFQPAIPTTLPGPHTYKVAVLIFKFKIKKLKYKSDLNNI